MSDMPIINRGHDESRAGRGRERARTVVQRVPRWVWMLLAIFVALLVWSMMTRMNWDDSPLITGTEQSAPAADAGDRAAGETATTYETGIQTGNPDVVCPLEVDEQRCRRIYGGASSLPSNSLVQPVTVVETVPVSTAQNSSGVSVTGTGVLVEWQVTNQDAGRAAILVADGKIIRRVLINSANAGADLPTLLGGQVR